MRWPSGRSEAAVLARERADCWFRAAGLITEFSGITAHRPLPHGLADHSSLYPLLPSSKPGSMPCGVSMAGPHQPADAAVLAMTRRRRPADPAGKAGMVQPG